jgi:hypothetical protein
MALLTQHLKVIALAEQSGNKRRKIIVALQRPCGLDVIYLNFLRFEPVFTFSTLMFVLMTLTSDCSLCCLQYLILNRVARECST